MIFLLGPATVDVLRSGGQHRGKKLNIFCSFRLLVRFVPIFLLLFLQQIFLFLMLNYKKNGKIRKQLFILFYHVSCHNNFFYVYNIYSKKNKKEKDFRQENSIFYIHKIQILLV